MIVQTPIGRLEFSVYFGKVEKPSSHVVTFKAIALEHALPKGMSVEKTTGVLVEFAPRITCKDVHVGFRWLAPVPCTGDPESGERLGAQSWVADGCVVTVGTEDYEALDARLPELALTEEDCPVTYHPDGMDVNLPIIAADVKVGLHFIVAVNTFPEPAELSTWFAVDVGHRDLLLVATESYERSTMQTIDVSATATAHELHAILASAFLFPSYYGYNWDAFWDCITDSQQSCFPDALEVIGYANLTEKLPREAALLQRALSEFQAQNASFRFRLFHEADPDPARS